MTFPVFLLRPTAIFNLSSTSGSCLDAYNTERFRAKTASTAHHSLLYMYCVPRMLFILKHYIKDLAYCMHAIINISQIV